MTTINDHALIRPMPWADQATCRTLPVDVFYGGKGASPDMRIAAACRRCPVQADCYQHALHHERYGYWAGTTELDRKQIRQRLGIAVNPPRAPQEDNQ